MRAAIINNGASSPDKILSLLDGASCEVVGYADIAKLCTDDFDVLVLSGSSQFPVVYNREKLKDEIALIQTSNIPVLGICYGCELIAVAFGGSLRDRGEGSQKRDSVEVEVVADNPLFLGRRQFEVYDAHRWAIDTVPPDLQILARSIHGPEVIRHRSRPIYGFQFHPEKMLEQTFGDELFRSFLKLEVR